MNTVNPQMMLHTYNGMLNEVISQRKGFASECEFWTMWVKLAGRVNQIQGYLLRHSIRLEIPDKVFLTD